MKITRIIPFALLIGMAVAMAQTGAPAYKGKLERIKDGHRQRRRFCQRASAEVSGS